MMVLGSEATFQVGSDDVRLGPSTRKAAGRSRSLALSYMMK